MEEKPAYFLGVLIDGAPHLRDARHFDWSESIHQASARLRFNLLDNQSVVFVGIIGGASSGKSTIFNNLLAGHLTSRIAARGHTTLGPILAAHESKRTQLDQWWRAGQLFPNKKHRPIELDANEAGSADVISMAYHEIPELENVLLMDLPDFTSQAAHVEGDAALSLLPWFDRIVVVVDQERLFDRQAISLLRRESSRFGQERFVLFNRAKEGVLADQEKELLQQQASRLGAMDYDLLEFRRGRGFCLFPPDALAKVKPFLRSPTPKRNDKLLGEIAESCNRVLNQNEERAARMKQLNEVLEAVLKRLRPSTNHCMMSLMTSEERRNLDLVKRVLRLPDTKKWVANQSQRFMSALKPIPIFGKRIAPVGTGDREMSAGETDRLAIGEAYYVSVMKRMQHDVYRAVSASTFWDEIRRWTKLEPKAAHAELSASTMPEAVRSKLLRLDEAMKQWLAKVEAECRGISPSVKGAIGAGAIALVVVLIAAEGPVAALTVGSVKAAMGAALTKLGLAAGAGALLGKPLGRLVDVAQERLIGSEEYAAVLSVAEQVRLSIESGGRRMVDDVLKEASALVMSPTEELAQALRSIREMHEDAQ